MENKDVMDQLGLLIGMMEKQSQEIKDVRGEIKNSETRIKVFIENQVTDKINGLFDGYKSALSNQAILEMANKTLAEEISQLKNRVTTLENRTA